ncbi:pyridoxal-phosphate dependent enzyme [Microbulbifer thermotolerans]|nr:pyridoxal-phosphate dependent enzyme [Microbulbifer thermotolerans]
MQFCPGKLSGQWTATEAGMMSPRYLTHLDPVYLQETARQIPYQRIHCDLFPAIEVWIRRDDLLDPVISGNKAYKLLFNLLEAEEQGAHTIVTCGGAWSNHIHATAAAGTRFGFRTIGIIRGERRPVLSATLQDAERLGMQLRFVRRETYRRRNEPEFLSELGLAQPGTLYIPEGGANLAGARGIQLLGQVIEETAPIDFDQLWLACGTGLTAAGLAASITRFSVCGVEVLKAGSSIQRDVEQWLKRLPKPYGAMYEPGCTSNHTEADLFLNSTYHCGGYAKNPQYLRDFQKVFECQTGIPLDPVYTAKLMYALHRESEGGRISSGSRMLVLHSGGLQGRRGFREKVLSKRLQN